MIRHILALFILLLSFVSLAETTPSRELQQLLDLDRFHTYTQAWANTMRGRTGGQPMAQAVAALTPRQISEMQLPASKLADAFHYDELILQILTRSHPQLNATPANVKWGYDFYKRNLNDAYQVRVPNSFRTPAPTHKDGPQPHVGAVAEVTPASSADVLLDVDSYVTDRSTRAVFWEASQSSRPIDLHVGMAADFRTHLANTGGQVVGEIRTTARNYNPIFLVQYPGEATFRYAVTEISGQDRVRHYVLQSALVRWERNAGQLAPPPPVHLFGDVLAKLANEEATLTQVLRVLPRAQQTVLGQKGAFERTFQGMGRLQAMFALQTAQPTAVASALTAEHNRLLQRARAESDLTAFVMKNASAVDRMYERALSLFETHNIPVAPAVASFELDRGSYKVSDYILQNRDGSPQRWRIFSNVWGDEVLPIARALKATNYNNIAYIGTAGALPNSNLQVGDLVIPENAYGIDGATRPLRTDLSPVGARRVDTVAHVSSPFEENRAWLEHRNSFAQVVEIETGYLASVFDRPTDRVNTMLLVSDLVGVEGQTLAHADSGARRRAQTAAISAVIDEMGAVSPARINTTPGLLSWIDELAPNRDPASRLQVLQLARLRGIETRDGLAKLLRDEPSFTSARVETSLRQADARLARLLDEFDAAGLRPGMSVPHEFSQGRWNPARGPVRVSFDMVTPEGQQAVNEIVARIIGADETSRRFLIVDVTSSVSAENTRLAGFLDNPNATLLSTYQDAALRFGGLAATETRSGGLRFVQVTPPLDSGAMNALAFFAPDEPTRNLMQNFSSDPDLNLQNLQVEIEQIQRRFVHDLSWQQALQHMNISVQRVVQLDGGALAKIIPEVGEDKIEVRLLITEAGLRNPAVVQEEILHLHQIFDSTWRAEWEAKKLSSFGHPYVWVETVMNARAGSPMAREQLARMELEAARALQEFPGRDLSGEPHGQAYAEARLAHAERIHLAASREARTEMRRRQAGWNQARLRFDELEKGPRLNELVVANDRAGTRRLIESYMPWDLMEPSEQYAWRQWLDAMEAPLGPNRQVVFRGLNDDILLTGSQSGEPGLFSTILSRNQGSYTRRLRSLTTMRERFGVTQSHPGSFRVEGSRDVPSLLSMMLNHSSDPVGSPFISVSDYQVAAGFGGMRFSALQLNPERVIPNGIAFSFAHEVERLVPLVIFPEEVIYAQSAAKDSSIDHEAFRQEVQRRIGRELTPSEIGQGRARADEFFRQGFHRIRDQFLDATRFPSAGGVCGPGNVVQALENLLR